MQDLIRQLSTATRESINRVDISKDIQKIGNFFINYYKASAGAEHYRLLSYISKSVNGCTILDVGTYLGYSAIALSQNTLNKVVSFDIDKQHNQEDSANVEYRIGDAIEYENYDSVKVILLDTYHDGVYETLFINHLRDIKWSGLLILDDIHEYPKLKELFAALPEEKYDITNIGHWSGTAVVLFKGQS